MKKALFVSLLSTVALLSVRAQAEVLCTLGAPTPYESMADMPAGPAPQAESEEARVAAVSEGLRQAVPVREFDVAQHRDGDPRRRRIEDRVQPRLREVGAVQLRPGRDAGHLRARSRPPPGGRRQPAGVDAVIVGQRGARGRVGGLRDGQGGAQAVRAAGGAAGAVGVPVGETSGVGRAAARHHRGIQGVRRPPAATAGQGSRRAGHDHDRQRRQGRRRDTGRGCGRVHRRQGLPARARVHEQPVRRGA